MPILPPSASPDAGWLVAARTLRGVGDRLTSVLLPAFGLALGYSELEVGALSTAALLGSAVLTLAVGLVAHRVAPRHVLFAASLLLLLTGVGFATASAFALLLLVAFVGTL